MRRKQRLVALILKELDKRMMLVMMVMMVRMAMVIYKDLVTFAANHQVKREKGSRNKD